MLFDSFYKTDELESKPDLNICMERIYAWYNQEVDGKGVARHLDRILELPEINAIQWVQGMGNDTPIMQWVPLIKKVQSAGKSLVIDLKVSELESFMSEVDPKGILLCIDADLNTQNEILRRVKKWK